MLDLYVREVGENLRDTSHGAWNPRATEERRCSGTSVSCEPEDHLESKKTRFHAKRKQQLEHCRRLWCCPLDSGTQFELNDGNVLKAVASNTSRLKYDGTRVIESWAMLKIKFNVR